MARYENKANVGNMARHDNKANVGFGRAAYPDPLSHPLFFDTEGRKHAVVGYAATHNYVATSEQLVEFRHSSGTGRDLPMIMPWESSIHDWPHKDDGFFPKVYNHVDHGENVGLPWKKDANEPSRLAAHDQRKGSPHNRDASDPSRFAFHDQNKGSPRNRDTSDPSRFAFHDPSKGSPRNRDESDPSRFAFHDQSKVSPPSDPSRFAFHDPSKGSPRNRDASDLSRFAFHDQSKGSPRNRDESDPSRFAVYEQSKGSPRNRDASDPSRFAVHDQSKGLPRARDASYPSHFPAYGQSKGSPQSKDAYESSRFMSPPSKDHYYNTHEHGKNNAASDDEDEVICEDGVCFLNKKGGSKPVNHPKQEDYDQEKHRYGYAPKRDSYYDTSYDNNNEKYKGNDHVPPYAVPITTPPRKETYYETSTPNNIRPIVDGPKPIKTRTGADLPKENVRNSPVSNGIQHQQYNGSPRKDQGAGTITSAEAARRYKGVLLKN